MIIDNRDHTVIIITTASTIDIDRLIIRQTMRGTGHEGCNASRPTCARNVCNQRLLRPNTVSTTEGTIRNTFKLHIIRNHNRDGLHTRIAARHSRLELGLITGGQVRRQRAEGGS